MNYKDILSMCQIKIKGIGVEVTRDLIKMHVDQILSICPLSTEDRTKLISELEERFTVWAEEARVLSCNDDHHEWLSVKSSSIKWNFWDRYKIHLKADMPEAAVDNIHEATKKILRNLEDPYREGPWDRRGLIMGNVQSGKTANYTGLICKAVDAGYKVIIVLAGMHNNLRSQTQIRLDEGFLGYKASNNLEENGAFKKATGVGFIDKTPKALSVTYRNEKGDFSKQFAQQFTLDPGGIPLLFVVKKQKNVLQNLLSWIRGSAMTPDQETGRKFHADVPLLVIDDEADQASVDTNDIPTDENDQPLAEHDPTTINKLIRQLLYSFAKSAYVGYTATPFANIYIQERATTKDAGPDLFPGSFIINLTTPSNYIGAAQVFGIESDKESGLEQLDPLPITRIVNDYAVHTNGIILKEESEGWMPPKLRGGTGHIPIYEGKRRIPPSLEKAIKVFILSTTVRKLREGAKQHNSMLIHVTRFNAIQLEVTEQTKFYLNQIRSRIQNGDGSLRPTIIEELRDIWDTDFVPTSKSKTFNREPFNGKLILPEWESVAVELWNVVSSIEIMTINGSAADALEYENHGKCGLNVIAIGGDKLSRGLTLEGLTVSYFLRASKMYDTLMQMGRWFGYRSKYADVCRLFTTEELNTWFAHISLASEELKNEFDYMCNVGGTPRDYGLKVRSHPLLLVTSRTKMRSGTSMKLSFAGNISETVIFHTGQKIINENFDWVSSWLSNLGEFSPDSARSGGYLWKNVKTEEIITFLGNYRTHKDAHKVKTELLSAYIKRQLEEKELANWSVLLVSSSSAKNFYDIKNIGKVGLVTRSKFPTDAKVDNKYTIKRLLSPADESKDLSKEEKSNALEQSIINWENDSRKNKSATRPSEPSGRAIRAARPPQRGFLLIYPLDQNHAGVESDKPIMGIAISFPCSKRAKEISYTVNQIFNNFDEFEFS